MEKSSKVFTIIPEFHVVTTRKKEITVNLEMQSSAYVYSCKTPNPAFERL